MPMTSLDYLFKQYENILSWYVQAESKSTVIHAMNGLLVGALNGLVFVGADKFTSLSVPCPKLIWTLLLLTAASLVTSYLFMLKAVWARHHESGPPLTEKEKLWFFEHVGSMSRDAYKDGFYPFDESSIEATMLAQNHILSRNVITKYDALNWAISLTIVAIISFFCLGIAYACAVIPLDR